MISILLLFNDNDELSVQQICEATSLGYEQAQKLILKLCKGKSKSGGILSKKGWKSQKLHPDLLIELNTKWKESKKKSTIAPINFPKINFEDIENRSLLERIDLTERILIRTMKTSLRLDKTTLLETTTKSLSTHFKPSPTFILHRIEILTNNHYLQTDKTNHNILLYTAE